MYLRTEVSVNTAKNVSLYPYLMRSGPMYNIFDIIIFFFFLNFIAISFRAVRDFKFQVLFSRILHGFKLLCL